MHIIHVTKSEFQNWNNYINSHPDATFYHRVEWKEIMEKSFGHKTFYLMALDNGKVTGILPIVHTKSLIFGSILCSMPFLNFGGICADNEEAELLLLTESEKILKDINGDFLELRHLVKSSQSLPTKKHKVSMTIELNSDPEILWNNFKGKHRTNIRRAAKNGLEIKVGSKELLKDFYAIESIGWRDLGTPFYRKSFFNNILEAFENSVEIYLVIYQGRPIATAFNGLFRDTVDGMWTYSLREFAELQTTYFIYWEMIKRACQEGYRQFHLGRSTTESGGSFFKKKWNATPKQLYWEYILNKSETMPELNVDNSKYQFAIKLWKKLPLPVTKTLGPFLAKSIP